MAQKNQYPIFNVFQPGLRRGAEQLPHDPKKKYFYVEHPEEGWRVYLRSVAFLHPIDEEWDPTNFLVVKRTGSHMSSATWEPPKGQMEWKDTPNGKGSIYKLLEENVKREVEEEAHVTVIKQLLHTGLVFQSQETSYPRHHFFQYHLFYGFLTPKQIKRSFEIFKWIKEHPKGFERWGRDRKEKDAVSWFNPRLTKLNPRWCPDIVALYLTKLKSKKDI